MRAFHGRTVAGARFNDASALVDKARVSARDQRSIATAFAASPVVAPAAAAAVAGGRRFAAIFASEAASTAVAYFAHAASSCGSSHRRRRFLGGGRGTCAKSVRHSSRTAR